MSIVKEFVEKLVKRLEEETYSWNDGYRNGMKGAIEIVNKLAEEYNQGWIPVSKSLPNIIDYPEQKNRVLASYDDGIVRNTTIKSLISGEVEYSMNHKIIKPIAWMPLPEPYKPEEPKNKARTRFERFRDMSIEELADMIFNSEWSDSIDFCGNSKECAEKPDDEKIEDDMCKKCIIKWLNTTEKQKEIPTKHYEERFNKVM